MQAGTETCDSRGTQITYELHHPNGEVTKHKAFDPSQAMAEHTIKQHAAKMGATAKITGVQMPSGAISSHPSVTGHYQNNVGDSDRAMDADYSTPADAKAALAQMAQRMGGKLKANGEWFDLPADQHAEGYGIAQNRGKWSIVSIPKSAAHDISDRATRLHAALDRMMDAKDAGGTQIKYELHHPNGEITKHTAFDPSQALAEMTIKQHAARENATPKIVGVQMPSGAWSSHPGVTAHYQGNVGDRGTRLHAALDCVMDRMTGRDAERDVYQRPPLSPEEAKTEEAFQRLLKSIGASAGGNRGGGKYEYSFPNGARGEWDPHGPHGVKDEHLGFKKLEGELAERGAKSPGGLAAWIGVEKNDAEVQGTRKLEKGTTDASDRASRLHRALDCIMDRRARAVAADAQPPRDVKYKGREYHFTGKVGTHPRDSQYAKKGETGYEYERLDSEGNKTGERIWQYANGKIQEDAAPSGLTAEDGGLLSSLLEHATGAVKAGIGAMSPTGDEAHEHAEVTKAKAEMEAAQAAIRMAVAKHERKVGGDSRAGRLHRALDCVLDRKRARQ
jgi:hypothetical protein